MERWGRGERGSLSDLKGPVMGGLEDFHDGQCSKDKKRQRPLLEDASKPINYFEKTTYFKKKGK